MGSITTDDGVALAVDEVGSGIPILFVHEFAGDHRSWEPQLRWFSRSHRCIVYAARGYPPSDVPTDPDAYSQERAVADALAVLDALGIDQAHVVGHSMGGFVALHLARLHPERVLSVTAVGTGYGAAHQVRATFQAECERIAATIEAEGMAAFAARYALGPSRVQLLTKDPRGHAEFAQRLAEHSAIGSAATMRGFQGRRPSLFDFEDAFAAMTTPALLIVGDEDDGCLDACRMLKRVVPGARLAVLPGTGHGPNLEEPTRFNGLVEEHVAAVDGGWWRPKDPRASATSLTGMDER